MLIRGTRTVRIRKYVIHDRQCTNCNDLDLTVKVYGDYFHIWFIPIYALGMKSAKIQCNNCGKLIRSDSLAREYESRTRTPFYFFSALILAGLAAVAIVGVMSWGAYLRGNYIAHPAPGDVYLIKTNKPISGAYHFARVMRISGDSVIAWDNNVNYLSLDGYPSKLDCDDYFSAERELVYTRGGLKEMYDKDSIVNVFRGGENKAGFNRIK